MLGNIQSNTGMNVLLQDFSNLINSNYEQADIIFPIYEDGFYYIGFHCYSDANMFNLYIDDVEIFMDGVNFMNNYSSNEYNIFPNPFQSEIYVSGANLENSFLQLFDLRGRIVFEKYIYDTNLTNINLSNLDCGVYYLTLYNREKIWKNKIIKLY